jgi:hypothetical protein
MQPSLRCGNPQKAYLVAQSMDALQIARMFRLAGDIDAARMFAAMSAGYLAASKANG